MRCNNKKSYFHIINWFFRHFPWDLISLKFCFPQILPFVLLSHYLRQIHWQILVSESNPGICELFMAAFSSFAMILGSCVYSLGKIFVFSLVNEIVEGGADIPCSWTPLHYAGRKFLRWQYLTLRYCYGLFYYSKSYGSVSVNGRITKESVGVFWEFRTDRLECIRVRKTEVKRNCFPRKFFIQLLQN